ncbi:Nickel-binding periplasmic protein precursor (plasmid) [Tsukamurella tyrosinosolvens]|uniref:Peptide/nickel transport system substrate-binding protein n=1 Tax=Tsukamurella tyrosinosolvens TaxID=57704 RepID=A0A1H4MYT2_TSUTY|nr:ABC transporter substrate-binding protein [Tsukamurella tyrosinosolvens]SEB88123.1 peptide/nickel transport system substrate-binding protein [Tsukamurella tyrosinosolvens]VEI00531.1 Nickel-binding periplasmic protein precursor [Tsukamurella tyrosinosolvens]
MSRSSVRIRAARAALCLLVAAASAVGCSRTEYLSTDPGRNLSIDFATTAFVKNFNFLSPTNPGEPPGSDLVYEPLIRLSPSEGYEPKPWLAASWAWSDGGKTLTWTLRDDVTWSDGTPFTSRDVAFTLELGMKNAQLRMGNTGKIVGVEAPTPTRVVVRYSEPAFASFVSYYAVKIVPEHVWAHRDAATDHNVDPIGTGPFLLSTVGVQRIVYSLRPDYWGAESKGVRTVTYNAAATPNAILNNLLTGKADYAQSPLIGDPKKTFVDKSPTNHFWLAKAGAGNALLFNNAVKPTDDVNIRRAIYASLDAGQLVRLTPGATDEAANVTGLNEPTYTDWIAPEFRGKRQTHDADAAREALRASGYTVRNGTLTKDGRDYPITLKIEPTQATSPWANGIKQQIFETLGVEAIVDSSVQNSSVGSTGDYTLTLGPDILGQGALTGLRFALTAPTAIGESASSNWSRANSPAGQALLAQMGSTADVEKQRQKAFELQRILVSERFTAPISPYAWPVAYTSKKWTGWPNQDDPQNVPPNGRGDLTSTILNLTPVSESK